MFSNCTGTHQRAPHIKAGHYGVIALVLKTAVAAPPEVLRDSYNNIIQAILAAIDYRISDPTITKKLTDNLHHENIFESIGFTNTIMINHPLISQCLTPWKIFKQLHEDY